MVCAVQLDIRRRAKAAFPTRRNHLVGGMENAAPFLLNYSRWFNNKSFVWKIITDAASKVKRDLGIHDSSTIHY